MENWKPVVDYEDRYEVSDLGRVRNVMNHPDLRPGYIHSPNLAKGYPRIELSRCCKTQRFHVRRLVLAAFVGPCPKGQEANHKNGNREDNRLENLEYVTRRQNLVHRTRVLGTGIVKGSKHGRSKLTEEKVLAIRRMDEMGMKGYKIAELFKMSIGMVSLILNRKNWTHV